jgi:hypothetical protein
LAATQKVAAFFFAPLSRARIGNYLAAHFAEKSRLVLE